MSVSKIRMFTLPNMVTLANLACGCAALFFCFSPSYFHVVLPLVVAAAAFDFADGFAARLTGQYSQLGKQLDSLADMVSFGVAPSAAMFSAYASSGGLSLGMGYGVVCISIALFSALRLARFNIDTEQSKEFIGLPTPASALFSVSLAVLVVGGTFTVHPLAILGICLVVSYLMVSPVRMFALKFTDYSWGSNRVRYGFLVFSAAALAVFRIRAIPFIIGAYVLVSAALHFTCRGASGGDGARNE